MHLIQLLFTPDFSPSRKINCEQYDRRDIGPKKRPGDHAEYFPGRHRIRNNNAKNAYTVIVPMIIYFSPLQIFCTPQSIFLRYQNPGFH